MLCIHYLLLSLNNPMQDHSSGQSLMVWKAEHTAFQETLYTLPPCVWHTLEFCRGQTLQLGPQHWYPLFSDRTSLVAHMVKHLPTIQETQVQSRGWEDLLEKEIATHSSILAWKIPWTEEPGGL